MQSFENFELISVDDASVDNTGNILREYASRDKRIIILTNRPALGLAGSINKGIGRAKGKYIARIDAGDRAEPDRFQQQVEFMEKFNDISILGSCAYLINSNKEIIGEWKVARQVDVRLLYKKGGVIHPTVIIRKELFDKIGRYEPSYGRAEDYELWARALKNRLKISNHQEFLTSVMLREGGISAKYYKTMAKDTFRVKLKYLPYFFNFINLIYTLRSLIGYLLPAWLFWLLVFLGFLLLNYSEQRHTCDYRSYARA